MLLFFVIAVLFVVDFFHLDSSKANVYYLIEGFNILIFRSFIVF